MNSTAPRRKLLKWECIPDDDIYLYGRSCRKAAETMMGNIELDGNPFAGFDACSIISMYRYAVEVHLKALVLGDGGNFLPNQARSLFRLQNTFAIVAGAVRRSDRDCRWLGTRVPV